MVTDAYVTGQTTDAEFSFRSDRLALDFAATLMFREPPEQSRELITDPQTLARWASAAGLLDAAPPNFLAGSHGRAIEVREAVYRVARALIGGDALPAEGIAILNRHAAKKPVGFVLTADGALRRTGSLDQVVAFLARDGIELFGGPDATRINQCARTGCTRLFVDRTRGHTRVWCGMSSCGNRVNAAAYRSRRARGS